VLHGPILMTPQMVCRAYPTAVAPSRTPHEIFVAKALHLDAWLIIMHAWSRWKNTLFVVYP